MSVKTSERYVIHLTSFLRLLTFIQFESYCIMKYHFVGYISISIYLNILFVLKFDFKQCLMHFFFKCHLLVSFDALAINTHNFSRKVGTEKFRGRDAKFPCSPKAPLAQSCHKHRIQIPRKFHNSRGMLPSTTDSSVQFSSVRVFASRSTTRWLFTQA